MSDTPQRSTEMDQLRGVENRYFAAKVLAELATGFRDAAHQAIRRTHDMPRPTIQNGFPPGYRDAMRDYRRNRAAERAMTEAAENLGILAEFNPLYGRIIDEQPAPRHRRPPETAPKRP